MLMSEDVEEAPGQQPKPVVITFKPPRRKRAGSKQFLGFKYMDAGEAHHSIRKNEESELSGIDVTVAIAIFHGLGVSRGSGDQIVDDPMSTDKSVPVANCS